MSKNIALKIDNYSYDYPSDWLGKPRKAVSNLSLEVVEGECFGFLGHSGAGKTTTIKSILGLTHPTNGTIEIFGKDHRAPNARSEIGYLPEHPYFYDHLNARELVYMFALLAGVPKNSADEATTNALSLTKMLGRENSKLRSLSKGLTQRVAMSQAIVHKPKLLILDEPFSGLDPIGRKEFKDLLLNLKNDGATIFVSSHILEDIESLCDRASIMSHGELKSVVRLDNLSSHIKKILSLF